MAEQFERFFRYIVNPDKPRLKLPDALNHQYSQLVPVQCTINTREGRRYLVKLRGNCFRVVFAEGWLNFVRGEEIKTDNCLWFDRTSLTDFIVTVHTDNQVERPLRHRFTLEIKKTHVERARLPVPINFWRSYVLTDPSDTFRAILEFEGMTYELRIVQGHGKVLMQNLDAEEFVEATEMVEGSILCFTLVPYYCVRFESEVGTCMWQEVLSHSFIRFKKETAQTYCKMQSNAQSSSHTTRGSNYSSTSHASTNNDTPPVYEIASPDIVRDYPLGVFDIHAKTVFIDEDDREEALELWPLADHYCSNNPEPLWETLKIIFEPLRLDPYPGETRAMDERNRRKLDQVIRDYWAEERRMATQRRRRGN
ncbi:B3 domain-containing protein [Striga asiatica]|uniref:B3 domain-containing protein n=1 Tax=Striga asiatica TaxID=4170 RepID=A0A5A7PTC4_STRAF|nr:B3 domain-containing protein [Striga asiatica]